MGPHRQKSLALLINTFWHREEREEAPHLEHWFEPAWLVSHLSGSELMLNVGFFCAEAEGASQAAAKRPV